MALTLVLAESALQTVPVEIQSHSQIKRYAERREKGPGEVLLDRAFHHAAMTRLSRIRRDLPVERMGRPDIVHNVLLQVLETPLNWEGHFQTFVHTQDDCVISIDPTIRLPRNYTRFVGLVEQLFAEKRVPKIGHALLSVRKMSLPELVSQVRSADVIAFSTLGKPRLLRHVSDYVGKLKNPVVLIGGFPRGHFTDRTRKVVSETFKIDQQSLDAWVVAGRFVYDFEWSIGVAEMRLKHPAQVKKA